jgi:prevent-host-death family protein
VAVQIPTSRSPGPTLLSSGRAFLGLDALTGPDQTWSVKSVNVQEAKTHLSRLLEEAVAGEEIVIAKAGRPYVKLVPCLRETTPRTLGGWEGKLEIAEDFDNTPEEVIRLFEGEDGTSLEAKRRR